MRKHFLHSLVVVALFGCVSYAMQVGAGKASGDSAVGTWVGSWTGGSSGKFEMTIEKGADSKLTGSLTASPTDGTSYTSKLKSVEVTANKLSAKLEDPDGEVEIFLEGNIDVAVMKGTYSVRQKGQTEQVDGGTFEAKKK